MCFLELYVCPWSSTIRTLHISTKGSCANPYEYIKSVTLFSNVKI